MHQMLHYSWPGNVRELEHSIERALLLSSGEEIEPANLLVSGARPATPSLDNMSIDEMEAMLIRKVLRRCDGNISQAAESLGLSRAALYRRMEKYGL
jgi:DNA-binding NtrC family response regulator